MVNRKNMEIKLVREICVKDFVAVTGLTRSGKAVLAPIVSSLERAENIRMDFLMEQFPMLHNLGLMTDDVVVYLMRYAVHFMLYNIYLGREANFRPTDFTSIWNTGDPAKYFMRLYAKEGEEVYERIEKEKPLFLMMLHNALAHADIFFKAFPEMKMLHVQRHPVDIIHSWFRKGYGKDCYGSLRNGTPAFQWRSEILPYFAAGWEDEYVSMTEVDRIIHMINRALDMHDKAYASLSDKDRAKVMIITFEKMVTDPKPILSEICSFLGTKETLHTPAVLVKERCPRVLPIEERKNKLEEIRSRASSKAFDLLSYMIDEYESSKA